MGRICFDSDGIGDFFSEGLSRVLPFQLNPEIRIFIGKMYHEIHPCLWDLLWHQARRF